MPLTTVAAATTILANAMKALSSLREQAKGSKDAALKDNISKLYDSLLDLKEALIRVSEENSELRRIITEQASGAGKPEIRPVGAVNYYFVGDKGPYCQPCYDGKQKLVALTPAQESNNGIWRRCVLCQQYFWEKPENLSTAFGTVSGPDGWMR
jgi:hypothetical protein